MATTNPNPNPRSVPSSPDRSASSSSSRPNISRPRNRNDSNNVAEPSTDRPEYDEHNTAGRKRGLGARDVFALVFNKMVGTGIFTTPGLVVALTHSARISIGLWVVGGFYIALCLLIYLELGSTWPHNGGEVIYLDKIWPCGFLFAVCFTGYHLCFEASTGNALAFGRYVVIAATEQHGDDISMNYTAVKFVSICALTLATGTLFLPKVGLSLNKLLVYYKIILLIYILSKTWSLPSENVTSALHHDAKASSTFKDGMSSFVYVIYTYTGWENGNYVGGELGTMSEHGPNTKLIKGSMAAVGITMLLYVLTVTAYYHSNSYESITKAWILLGMGSDLGPRLTGGHGEVFDILVAVSAFGNLVSVVYTSAIVKQAIAKQNFLPFSWLIQKDETVPKGGLILHWMITFIWILAIPAHGDGYDFVIGIYAYGRVLIETMVFSGFLYWTAKGLCFPNRRRSEFSFTFFHRSAFKPIVPIVTAIILMADVMILSFAAQQDRVDSLGGQAEIIPRWWWPTVIVLVFVGAGIYRFVIFILDRKTTRLQAAVRSKANQGQEGVEMNLFNENNNVENNSHSLGPDSTGLRFRLRVYEERGEHNPSTWPADDEMTAELRKGREDARADGSYRRVYTDIRIVPQWLRNVYATTSDFLTRYMV
ncbi:hypothetical protein MMC07_000012 [Pseudocyphellaria aurata]|nr:hypothetical protein [Pseudocyphellaria aurata]